MASADTGVSVLGDPQHGGAIFTLPREVRDEIYRLIVKGHYDVFLATQGRDCIIYHTRGQSCPRNNALATDKQVLSILEVSKAISHEASEIFYSESVFHFFTDFTEGISHVLPKQFTKRMQNIEFEFWGFSCGNSRGLDFFSCLKLPANILAIADFTGTDVARNSLRISFLSWVPTFIELPSGRIFEELKELVGFRTVVLEVFPPTPHFRSIPRKFQRDLDWGNDKITQRFKDFLEPAFGPATEGFNGHNGYLTFHPREHLAKSTE